MGVVMLPIQRFSQNSLKEEREHVLEPWNNVGEVKHSACSICISGTNWVLEWLEAQRTRVERSQGGRMRCVRLSGLVIADGTGKGRT